LPLFHFIFYRVPHSSVKNHEQPLAFRTPIEQSAVQGNTYKIHRSITIKLETFVLNHAYQLLMRAFQDIIPIFQFAVDDPGITLYI